MRASHCFLQVNCRRIYNKALECCNLVDTYPPNIIWGTESSLREEIENAEIFILDFTTFSRHRHAQCGSVFVCFKNNIVSSELWSDDEFDIIAVEVKRSDRKCTWELVGIYRSPNEDLGCVHTNRVESNPIQSSRTLESSGVHTDRVESNQVCTSPSGFLVLSEQCTSEEL